MRRLNRSTSAPIGTAFFLFVGLAIIPVSLKAAGLQLGFTPRLSAAIEIWSQVAEVFGPNYGVASGAELAALITSDVTPSPAASDDRCPLQQYACDREVEEASPASQEVTMASTQAAKAPRTTCKLASRTYARAKVVETGFMPAEISVNIGAGPRGFHEFGDRRAEATMRREVLNKLEKIINHRDFDQTSINPLPLPKSFRMLLRLKQPAVSSVTGAECKARAAMEAAGRFERASLKSTPADADNCDL